MSAVLSSLLLEPSNYLFHICSLLPLWVKRVPLICIINYGSKSPFKNSSCWSSSPWSWIESANTNFALLSYFLVKGLYLGGGGGNQSNPALCPSMHCVTYCSKVRLNLGLLVTKVSHNSVRPQTYSPRYFGGSFAFILVGVVLWAAAQMSLCLIPEMNFFFQDELLSDLCHHCAVTEELRLISLI